MDKENWGCLVVIGLIVAGIWFGIWGRHTSLRYQVQYDANSKMVTVDREPTDCEFLSAPLGRKDCHYEKEVTVEIYDRDTETGRPIVSRDGRKTWNWNEGGSLKGARVHVWWRKETP